MPRKALTRERRKQELQKKKEPKTAPFVFIAKIHHVNDVYTSDLALLLSWRKHAFGNQLMLYLNWHLVNLQSWLQACGNSKYLQRWRNDVCVGNTWKVPVAKESPKKRARFLYIWLTSSCCTKKSKTEEITAEKWEKEGLFERKNEKERQDQKTLLEAPGLQSVSHCLPTRRGGARAPSQAPGPNSSWYAVGTASANVGLWPQPAARAVHRWSPAQSSGNQTPGIAGMFWGNLRDNPGLGQSYDHLWYIPEISFLIQG